MKKLSVILIALALMMIAAGSVNAHQNNGIEGLLLGGAGGAIVGQALTRTPEGVIVGSIIGGTIGMLIYIGPVPQRVVVVNQPWHRPFTRHVSRTHRDHRRDRWDRGGYDNGRGPARWVRRR